jgi:foldase protein PrsA
LKRFIYVAGATVAGAATLVAVGLSTAGCGKGEGGDLAAVVNGDPITMNQYHRRLELMPAVQVIVDPARLQASGGAGPLQAQPYKGAVVGSLGLQALSDLINETVLKQAAKAEGVFPTEAEQNKELEDRKKANPNFVKDLTNRGYDLPLIRSDLALSLAQYKLTTKGINVSDEEVSSYIKDHPAEFEIPAKVDLLWMLVPEDKKALAEKDLNSAVDFMVVAQKYTVAQNAANMQYRFPEQTMPGLARISSDLMKAVEATGEEKQTKWLKFSDGWAKFYVKKKYKSQPMKIDTDLRERVKKVMMIQKGSAAKDLDQRLQRKLATAKITINIKSLAEPYRLSLETLKATAGAATTTTGAK